MPEEAMVVAIVAIGCTTSLLWGVLHTIRVAVTRPRALNDEQTAALRALVEEVKQLRQQNNDVILTMDTSLQRMDQRLAHLESRVALGSGASVEEPAPLIRRG